MYSNSLCGEVAYFNSRLLRAYAGFDQRCVAVSRMCVYIYIYAYIYIYIYTYIYMYIYIYRS